MVDRNQIPIELLEQFERGNVLLFVGEGINRGFQPLGFVNKQLPALIKRDKHEHAERWCSSTAGTHRELER